MEIGTVRQVDIDQQMQSAYLDYAMSVIVARALPDVRDGLKPVQRRILYAMHDMGLSPDKPYKKSARIVGEVLGKYHPHGDSPVYEAMARMAQDFSLRYMLVDGQGNFGSIDGDSPAAMRYTEARLSSIAEPVLADIDKDTVQFVPNFDESLAEPSVLPALLPNLLVNGASGIAVGMTTNIPPHNLGEVVDALVYVIDHYARLDDITVEDLTRFVQGPDFPTGGVVYRYSTDDGNGDRVDLIRNAYAVGRGRMTVQAHLYIEEMSRNRNRIVVTELPYQVNKTRLIERIAELVRDGKLEGITDLRDESDRQGMRLCIEMTRTVDPREVLSQLFRLTPMQTTFSLHMLALVDGEPRLLPLKRVLICYVEHRQEIVTRRSRYLLEKARLRAHILEGLRKALDAIDRVIKIIRGSPNTEAARQNLMGQLKLSEIQADAILEMPLKRLAALERQKIEDEYQQKLKEIAYLEKLLASPAEIRKVIREELLALKARYGDPRRTRIIDRERGHHTARELVEAQEVLLTLWQDGQVSLTATAPRVSARAAPIAQVRANTRDDAAFFSAGGQASLVPLHQLPEEQAVAVGSLAALGTDPLVGLLVLHHPPADEEAPACYVTLATRQGRIKRLAREDLVGAASRGAVTAISLDPGDRLGWAALTQGQEELILVTRQGMAIRFSEEEVRPMGLAAAGVMAVKLASDDAVVGMGVVRPEAFVVTFTEGGFAKRTPVASFPAQKRYGSGIQAARLTGRTGPVAVAAVAGGAQDLVLTTTRGRVARMPVSAIAAMGRATAGSHLPEGGGEPYFEPDKHGGPAWLAGMAETAEPKGKEPRKKAEEKPAAAPPPATKAAAPSTRSKKAEEKPATAPPPATKAAAPSTRSKKAEEKQATAPPTATKAATPSTRSKKAEEKPVTAPPPATKAAAPSTRSKKAEEKPATAPPTAAQKAPAAGTRTKKAEEKAAAAPPPTAKVAPPATRAKKAEEKLAGGEPPAEPVTRSVLRELKAATQEISKAAGTKGTAAPLPPVPLRRTEKDDEAATQMPLPLVPEPDKPKPKPRS